MSGHGHSHGGGCDHDHDNPEDMSAAYSLYQKIDLDRVECLNEVTDGSGKTIFKPWAERNDRSRFVESDADEELLFRVPFAGSVKLRGVSLIGGEEDTHPKSLRLFKNRPNMTFDETGSTPDQEFELTRDESGTVEYSIKAAKFNNVSQLCLHFPTNFGAEATKVYYIGLRGDFMQAHREEIVVVNYELNANPADHKNILSDHASQQIS
ncbi:PITH domain-containing protein 1-like [Watersipora subatra]|uniref:PITH domain-containing protein 1-like n=1 Tax=Watersipora subatra TaxID=2589382 RepID=UPI00355B6BD4